MKTISARRAISESKEAMPVNVMILPVEHLPAAVKKQETKVEKSIDNKK